jgi:hypothetical protein
MKTLQFTTVVIAILTSVPALAAPSPEIVNGIEIVAHGSGENVKIGESPVCLWESVKFTTC